MADFENYMSPGRRGHLIGIGGVSMSSLAEVLLDMGLVISGSDSMESQNVRNLRELGIHIAIGHSAENITDDIEFIVRTAAVHDDNPEIVAAREKDIPVFERTQAWGTISRDFDVYSYLHGCRERSYRHDRGYAPSAQRRAPHWPRKYDHYGSLRIL